MPPQYSFVTVWYVPAAVDRVWDALAKPRFWPRWWKGVEAVEELEAGEEDGLGALHRYTWKSALPYRLSFDMRVTQVDRHRRLEGWASGELEGNGVWTFTPHADGTLVRYDWNVRTTRKWMNLLAPALRPAFEWNHGWVMDSGERSLASLLGTPITTKRRKSRMRRVLAVGVICVVMIVPWLLLRLRRSSG